MKCKKLKNLLDNHVINIRSMSVRSDLEQLDKNSLFQKLCLLLVLCTSTRFYRKFNKLRSKDILNQMFLYQSKY